MTDPIHGVVDDPADPAGSPPTCHCGTFAVGRCNECRNLVCGDHSALVDDYRVCDHHGGEHDQDARNASARVAAVAAMYTSDRHDRATLIAQNLTLTSIALAYMGVVVAFVAKADPVDLGAMLLVCLPLPAWMVGAYHLLTAALLFTRSTSLSTLEARLVQTAGWSPKMGEQLGTRANDEFANVLTQPWPLRVQTLVAYGVIYLLIEFFTVYCIDVGVSAESGQWTAAVVVGSVVYCGLAAASVIGWRWILRPPSA